jgi:hypothetical protein
LLKPHCLVLENIAEFELSFQTPFQKTRTEESLLDILHVRQRLLDECV